MGNLEDLPRASCPEMGRKFIRFCMRIIGGQSTTLLMSYVSMLQIILTPGLNMRRVSAEYVPFLLPTKQEEHRVEVWQNFCQLASDDASFMSRIPSPVARASSTSTALRWINSRHNGIGPRLHRQRKHDRASIQSRACLLFSFFDIQNSSPRRPSKVRHPEFVSKTVHRKFYRNALKRQSERK